MLILNNLKFQRVWKYIISMTVLRWGLLHVHVNGSCSIFHLLWFSCQYVQLYCKLILIVICWCATIYTNIQPNNVQCKSINQIMLFSVDQRCYMYIVMWCWSAQIYKHARCQLVKCMKWPASLDYKTFWKLALPGKIFLEAYFVINDFSDIVFFKKRFIPHMEVFFFKSSLLLLFWNF